MGATGSIFEADANDLPDAAFIAYQTHIQKAVLAHVANLGLQGAELEAKVIGFIAENEKILRAEALQSASIAPIDDKKFSTKLTKQLDDMRESSAYKFMCGVDGSTSSDLCLDVLMKLRRQHDFVNVVHSYYEDGQKDLPPDAKVGTVLERTEIKLRGSMPSENYYSIKAIEREEGELAKNHIVRHLKNLRFSGNKRFDFWVCGYTGNRNRHSAENKGNPSIMGSTSDITLRNIHMPVVVIKRDIAELNKGRIFVVAVGSTDFSKHAVEIVLSLAMPRDKVIVIHVINPHTDGAHDSNATVTALERDYQHELDTIAPQGSFFKNLQQEEGETVDQTILKFVNENEDLEVDFLAIAPRANETNNHQYSSLAKELLLNAKSNIIIVKH